MMTDNNRNNNHAAGDATAVGSSGRSPRFSMWMALAVFATITLGSSVQIKKDSQNPSEAVKWAISCSAITFSLATIVSLLHAFSVSSTLVVGTVGEGIISLTLIAFWAAEVAVVTKTDNDLAFISSDAELNANLFFFSWAGFVTSLVLFVHYLKSTVGVDLVGAMNQRAARLTLWSALLATSLIVMGASVRVNKDDCSPVPARLEAYCTRANFGIALGAIGFAFALLIVALKLFLRSSSVLCEFIPAVTFAALQAFGVGYITGKDGPGASLGNLWMGSWLSFLISGAIAAEAFNNLVRGGGTEHTGGETSMDKDLHRNPTYDVDVEEAHDI